GWASFRRFPSARPRPLDEDRRELLSFVAQSSVATGVIALRNGLAPLLLGAVTSTTQVGLLKVAQAPQTGFQALSAPARLVLLPARRGEWERGGQAEVLRQVRRYSLVAALLCVVALPPLLWAMPHIVSAVYGHQYRHAGDAARLLALTAGVQLVVGWTKSFPV